MNDTPIKQMDAKDLAALIVGIAVTTGIDQKTKRELINAVFEAGLGIKDLLPEKEEE